MHDAVVGVCRIPETEPALVVRREAYLASAHRNRGLHPLVGGEVRGVEHRGGNAGPTDTVVLDSLGPRIDTEVHKLRQAHLHELELTARWQCRGRQWRGDGSLLNMDSAGTGGHHQQVQGPQPPQSGEADRHRR